MNTTEPVSRVQLWSCGGGRQSAGIAALILQGRLPKPDAAVMVDTGREKRSTWDYLNAYLRPAIERFGVPFTLIRTADYATVDLWSGEDGESLLIPAYSDQGVAGSKLPEWCSGEWKREVVARWARTTPGWFATGVDMWLGISRDERNRRRKPRRAWLKPTYPLLDTINMHVSGCLEAVRVQGWPEPPRSCCWMCPNQGNPEWRDLRDGHPDQWSQAVELDETIRLTDPHAWVHSSRVPLRLADIDAPDSRRGGCTEGMCS